ncbi:MAG: hypothetical protein ACI9BW_004776 [Gammaproteobacteria bacterium]|jgi:hypothetical protein
MQTDFDDNVLRGLQKWPNVPACYGWLRLDRRGNWLIKDQAISHRRAIEYLARNYASDELGRWFVQNGPQRAYCTLDYTPWVYHLDGCDHLHTHTNKRVSGLKRILIDETGDVLLHTEFGIGLLHDGDLARFIDVLDTHQEFSDGTGVADLLLSLVPETRDASTLTWHDANIPVQALIADTVAQSFDFEPAPDTAAEQMG